MEARSDSDDTQVDTLLTTASGALDGANTSPPLGDDLPSSIATSNTDAAAPPTETSLYWTSMPSSGSDRPLRGEEQSSCADECENEFEDIEELVDGSKSAGSLSRLWTLQKRGVDIGNSCAAT